MAGELWLTIYIAGSGGLDRGGETELDPLDLLFLRERL
jgi:hypothetical protein